MSIARPTTNFSDNVSAWRLVADFHFDQRYGCRAATAHSLIPWSWCGRLVGGILVLRELESDFWETWLIKPLSLLVFVALVGYSLWWDSSHWPPEQPAWVTSINFGSNMPGCCWRVWDCYDFVRGAPRRPLPCIAGLPQPPFPRSPRTARATR